jgi:hypothetical protein
MQIKDIKPYERNAKKHDETQIKKGPCKPARPHCPPGKEGW